MYSRESPANWNLPSGFFAKSIDRGIFSSRRGYLCFFVFSSSISSNEKIAAFLSSVIAGHEYIGSILVSQVISNVPAAIVLYPFAENRGALLYGLDSAGLVTIIGSLASVINYRLYVREYPGKGWNFIKTFTFVSLLFFLIVVVPGYLISLTPLT